MRVLALPVSRRSFLVLTGAFVGVRFCPALDSETTQVVSQPYFAGVNRVLEGLAKLGAPVAAADAQRIAVLARQGDSAAVDAAEKILDTYTLARLSIGPDETGRVEMGGGHRTLVEQ